jgi:uncharacterized protein
MKCPTCKKPVDAKKKNPFLPFCSERCKLIDLGKWLDEKYVITSSSTSPPENPAENTDD